MLSIGADRPALGHSVGVVMTERSRRCTLMTGWRRRRRRRRRMLRSHKVQDCYYLRSLPLDSFSPADQTGLWVGPVWAGSRPGVNNISYLLLSPLLTSPLTIPLPPRHSPSACVTNSNNVMSNLWEDQP